MARRHSKSVAYGGPRARLHACTSLLVLLTATLLAAAQPVVPAPMTADSPNDSLGDRLTLTTEYKNVIGADEVVGTASSPEPAHELSIDAEAALEESHIIYNNITAAWAWYNQPPQTAEDKGSLILHGVERIYGPSTLARIREANLAMIKATTQALSALQIKFRSRFVVEQYTTNGTLHGFPLAKLCRAVHTIAVRHDFRGFDLFFEVSLAEGLMLQAPFTADIVQLARKCITTQLQKDGLALGLLPLGITFPGIDQLPPLPQVTIPPVARFSSVIKVTGNLSNILPFEIEKQTLLVSVICGLPNSSSPVTSNIGTLNITAFGTTQTQTCFNASSARKLLADQQDEQPGLYVGMEMILSPAGNFTPDQVFEELLGGNRYSQQLDQAGLPMTPTWINTTVQKSQMLPDGMSDVSFTVYPLPAQTSGSSGALSPRAIAGIAIAAVAVLAAISTALIVASWARGRAKGKKGVASSPDDSCSKLAGMHKAQKLKAVNSSTSSALNCHHFGLHAELEINGRALKRSHTPSGVAAGSSSRNLVGSGGGGGSGRFTSSSIVSTIGHAEITLCRGVDGQPLLLGRGSFGEVFKGMRRGVQEVAVKKLHAQSANQQWLRQLDWEISILSSVSFDRNIVQYYGCVLEDAQSCMLVMEFMAGGDLRQAITRNDTSHYSWYNAGRTVALDIARGLHFLHSSGVVHRDLKTSNVLLTGEGVAKVSDVGLAKVMTAYEAMSWDKTAGTFCYAAPELILGVCCTEKVDIFSFGVILWELSTHEFPIRGQLRDVEVPDEAPVEIAALIDDCLQPNPHKRPTAQDLVTRIQAVPLALKGVRRSSSGPLARNIGRNNGQQSSDSSIHGSMGSFRSPGMIDNESLLASLYSS